MANSYRLPNGIEVTFQRDYTSQESNGIIVVVVFSFISLVAVVTLLGTIALSATKIKNYTFLRTHVSAYFFSLMLCHTFQAIASIMNARWASLGGLNAGNFCASQGVLKHLSDVGTALWTFVIAFHTFCCLFCEMEGLSTLTFFATLVGGWSTVVAIVIFGHAVADTSKFGPYYSISGLWCWISPQYKAQQVVLGWLLLILAAMFGLVAYPLVFLRLKGNVIWEGRRFRFSITPEQKPEKSHGPREHSVHIARHMLIYPATYMVLILPIVTARLTEASGSTITVAGLLFSDTIYQMFGLVNVVLFAATRPLLSSESLILKNRNISWPLERSGGSQVSAGTASQAPLPRVPDFPSHTVPTPPVKAGSRPLWTQREVRQPPEIVIRDSIGSIYSVYDDPPPSSHWSPDTPPKSARHSNSPAP